MDMKDQKKAVEIAEQRMAIISPLLCSDLDNGCNPLLPPLSQLKQRQCERYIFRRDRAICTEF